MFFFFPKCRGGLVFLVVLLALAFRGWSWHPKCVWWQHALIGAPLKSGDDLHQTKCPGKTDTKVKAGQHVRACFKSLRQPRIERGAHRWQRWILPLNH